MRKRKEIFLLLFWTFVFGSVFGYVHEMLLHYFKHGFWESRQGLIYGPFSQVYGLGAMFFVLTIAQIKDWKKVFLAGTLLGGFFEWICSIIQQYVFGTISWDYSNYFLNINGRTSLFHAICWGIIGLFFVLIIYPLLLKTVSLFNNTYGWIFTISLTIFLIIDIFLSVLAGIRQDEREKGIMATTTVQKTIDTWYPDDRMNRIYPNRKKKA